ncbi:exodeoxyribonuclease VII large subunit, partial [Staphylococcus epidermidis]|uniref:exodeoxyribonuclease VII large subunit n=1 Tax=Staphylococcus epidermidis TaxID=1282 RepID=UPI0037D9EC27
MKYKFHQHPHLHSLLIKPQLSNFKNHSTPHLYFNLNHKETLITPIIFKPNPSNLPFHPKQPHHLLIEPPLSLYQTRPNYQIYLNK